MADLTQPCVVIKLRLPSKYWVQVIVWNDTKELRQNAQFGTKDYVACFVPQDTNSRCIGTIHFSKTDLSNSTRAHELQHMISHFVYKAYDEKIAQASEVATAGLDAALKDAGLLV